MLQTNRSWLIGSKRYCPSGISHVTSWQSLRKGWETQIPFRPCYCGCDWIRLEGRELFCQWGTSNSSRNFNHMSSQLNDAPRQRKIPLRKINSLLLPPRFISDRIKNVSAPNSTEIEIDQNVIIVECSSIAFSTNLLLAGQLLWWTWELTSCNIVFDLLQITSECSLSNSWKIWTRWEMSQQEWIVDWFSIWYVVWAWAGPSNCYYDQVISLVSLCIWTCRHTSVQAFPIVQNTNRVWGLQSTEIAYLLLTQHPRVQFSAFPRFFFFMFQRFTDDTA